MPAGIDRVNGRERGRGSGRGALRAFTLLELIVVIAILGVASMLLIPSMDSVGSMRVQTAIRTIVSDITFAQADAIAFQQRRQVVFEPASSSYRLVQVVGPRTNPAFTTMYSATHPSGQYVVQLSAGDFHGARITRAAFNGNDSNHTLTFDELGTPVLDATSDQPGTGGVIVIEAPGAGGQRQVYTIRIDAFTGRVSVREGASP